MDLDTNKAAPIYIVCNRKNEEIVTALDIRAKSNKESIGITERVRIIERLQRIDENRILRAEGRRVQIWV